jgi:serine protease AprX
MAPVLLDGSRHRHSNAALALGAVLLREESMRFARTPNSQTLKVAALVGVILVSTVGVGGQRHRAKLSSDLLKFESRHPAARARVIVRGSRAKIEAMSARHGVPVVRWLQDSAVVLADGKQVSELAGDSANELLSGDPTVVPFMSVSNASTAADQTRAGSGGLLLGLGAIQGVTGNGVTVAVVDSGISDHPALADKVIANVSFVTGDPDVKDKFGHGTHIAGTIAGSKTSVTSYYTGGIAPGVKLVNVRVLGANGSGWTSDVIAGIEWTIANRDTYDIRIMNLSLGHPVTEPSLTDPLCLAVKKAVAAGIVVFVSAGNSGKAADGSQVLGGITSPGNSPYAITVGAINTKGTVKRNDDVMATYSSRGPTRFEFAVKPDVAAPGNKIVSLEAPGAALVKTNPQLHVAGKTTNAYMTLNGTSMSTAMVSGGGALLMQANPNITSEQLKMALQTGATFMKDGGLMGAGAGSVNFWSSRKTSANGLTALVSTVVGGLVSPASGLVYWDAGTMASRVYHRTGIRLLSLLEGPLAWLLPGFLRWGDLNVLGLSNPIGSTRPNEILWGDIANWTSDHEIMWGDTIYDPEGHEIMWGDSSVSDGDEIMWGDSVPDGDK